MKKTSAEIIKDNLIAWLLDGDVSIQYQVHRDLLDSNQTHLRDRIASEGWGAQFLSFRHQQGHWGRAFYQPKWTSTHYTILDLKHLGLSPNNQEVKESLQYIFQHHKGGDGGINPSRTIKQSDVCMNGMFLNYASYFGVRGRDLGSIIDFLITEQMPDGGFNCLSNRKGAVHSSLHSTISVLEGIFEYKANGYTYRMSELSQIETDAREFILQHKLYRSDHTGEIIDKRMLMLSYPSRWRYDILRALDYFQFAGVRYDPRMRDSLVVLKKKRRKDKKWPLQAKHPGRVHFEMENLRTSRWNTLRALRVLAHYGENG